ncbi:MAG: hypothetical protein GEV10_12320 [Streptosporangiales bacterium]|nr:hypothetical protein [Streptosporangiales bacterium]
MSTPSPPSPPRLAALTLLTVPLACAAIVSVDAAAYVLTAQNADLEVAAGGILAEAVFLALPVVFCVLVRRSMLRSRGRSTGVALTLTGVVAALAFLMLFFVGLAAPICDFGGGDACAYGTEGAPLPYAVVRTAPVLLAAAGAVTALVVLARPATVAWLARDRPAVRLPLSPRPFAPAVLIAAAAALAISALNFPAVAARVDGLRVDEIVAGSGGHHIAEAAREAYGVAAALAVVGVVLAVAAIVLARYAWRETPRRAGAVRVFGGLVGTACLGWMLVALAGNPVGWKNFEGYHLVEGPLPSWYPPTLGALVLLGTAASLACLVSLLLARLPADPRG